jgi:hypothetical protein
MRLQIGAGKGNEIMLKFNFANYSISEHYSKTMLRNDEEHSLFSVHLYEISKMRKRM